jgi:hypothetical protein
MYIIYIDYIILVINEYTINKMTYLNTQNQITILTIFSFNYNIYILIKIYKINFYVLIL